MSRVLIIRSDAQVSQEIGDALSAANFPIEYSAGHADALRKLRMLSFGVVITNPDCTVEEDLALLGEMRAIRPGVKSIVPARHSTPDDVIAALRARVFACFTPPFDAEEIANLARGAASDSQWRDDIQVLSARPGWVSVRVNCRPLTAERLMTFAKELSAQLPEGSREEMMQAFREILLNAMEHGAAFNPEQVVEVTAVRTSRSMVFSSLSRHEETVANFLSVLHLRVAHKIVEFDVSFRCSASMHLDWWSAFSSHRLSRASLFICPLTCTQRLQARTERTGFLVREERTGQADGKRRAIRP